MNIVACVEQRGGDRDRREALADRERMIFLTQRPGRGRAPATGARPAAAASAAPAGAGGDAWRSSSSTSVGLARLGHPRRAAGAVERILQRRLRRPAIAWCWAADTRSRRVARRLQRSAAPASSHTGSPVWLAPIASPAKMTYSFARSKIESSQAPSFEKCACSARAGRRRSRTRTRNRQQHRARHHAPARSPVAKHAAAAITPSSIENIVTWLGVSPRRAAQRAM